MKINAFHNASTNTVSTFQKRQIYHHINLKSSTSIDGHHGPMYGTQSFTSFVKLQILIYKRTLNVEHCLF